MRSFGISVSAAALALGALAAPSTHAAAPTAEAVLANYADIAAAAYEDAWRTAKDLQAGGRRAARRAQRGDAASGQGGLAGRARALSADRGLPLRQRDRRRLGGQGQCLAARRRSDRLRGGVLRQRIRREPLLRRQRHRPSRSSTASGETIDASIIDAKLLRSLHEIDAIEANVATGYHAVEFLLWGQDLNGTGPGAGVRPWTDFARRRVHRRQLRAAARLSEGGDRSPGRRSRGDGRQLAGGRRSARGAGRRPAQGGARAASSSGSAACPTASWRASG